MAAPWEIYPQFAGKVWHIETSDSADSYYRLFDDDQTVVGSAYRAGRIKCFYADWGERDPNNFVEQTNSDLIHEGGYNNVIFLMDQLHYDPVNDVMDPFSSSRPHRGYFYDVRSPYINFAELTDTSNVVVWSGFNYKCRTFLDSFKYLKVGKAARTLSTMFYTHYYNTVDSTTPLEKSQILQDWFDTFDTRGVVNENDSRYLIESKAGSAGFGFMFESFDVSNVIDKTNHVFDLSLWCADNQPTTPADWPPRRLAVIEPTWGGCPENPLYPSFKIDLSKIENGDLFAGTSAAGVTYKVTGKQVKGMLEDPSRPWDDWDGGIWHIINGPEHIILENAYPEGPYQAWDVDGGNEREITGILPNEELVFVTPPETEDLFMDNVDSTWDFGEYTDTSGVTTFRGLFFGCREFNGELGGNWDTSNVTNLTSTFYEAERFNQNIDGWITSKVVLMDDTFSYCKNFNQPLNSWDVSNVESMYGLFLQCDNFNRPLNNWQVGNVKNMLGTFGQCNQFNSDIKSWDMSNVTNAQMMFSGAGKFNQDISNWDVSNVTNMSSMFGNATSFNQDLSEWCVKKVDEDWRHVEFDQGAGFEGDKDRLPCWGHCPRGENGTVDPCPSIPDYYLVSPGIGYIKDGSGNTIATFNATDHHRPSLGSINSSTFIGLTQSMSEHEEPEMAWEVDKNSLGFGAIGRSNNGVKTTWHPGITKKEITLSPIFDVDKIWLADVLDLLDEASVEYENIDPVMYKFDGSLKITQTEFYEKTGKAIFTLYGDPYVEGHPEFDENTWHTNSDRLPAGTKVTGVEPGTWFSFDLSKFYDMADGKQWFIAYVDSVMKVQYAVNTGGNEGPWGDLIESNSFPAVSIVDDWSLTYLKDPTTEPLFEILGDQKSFKLSRDLTDLSNYLKDWSAANPGATDEEKLTAIILFSLVNKYNYEKDLVKFTLND